MQLGGHTVDGSFTPCSLQVVTEGMYLGLCDRASTVNRVGVARDALDSAGDEPDNLFKFNQFWIDHRREGQILPWTFSFDGVYRVEIRSVSQIALLDLPPEDPGESLGRLIQRGILRCPSGELILTSLVHLGDPVLESQIQIPPGDYRYVLQGNLDEQVRHEMLEVADDYPTEDGPDWLIYLAPDN